MSDVLIGDGADEDYAESLRWYLLKRYPFQVIYREAPDGRLLIVAVAQTSRRPGYWSKR